MLNPIVTKVWDRPTALPHTHPGSNGSRRRQTKPGINATAVLNAASRNTEGRTQRRRRTQTRHWTSEPAVGASRSPRRETPGLDGCRTPVAAQAGDGVVIGGRRVRSEGGGNGAGLVVGGEGEAWRYVGRDRIQSCYSLSILISTAKSEIVIICTNLTEIAKLIVDQMPDLIKQGDAINKSTPLHYAASRADIKMVRFLLETSRSAAYLRDNDGFSVIHVAASIGHVNIIHELHRRCPDCMEMKDVSGRNFLHVAIEKKRVEIVRYVLQSQVLAELANLPDNDGNTALHLAVRSHNRYITGLLLKNAEVYTSPMNNSGDTPLDLASSKMGNQIGHRMDKIRRDLIANGSRFGPQRYDILLEPPPRNQVEELNRYRAIVNNLSIVAVLIATVTFAAVFTLPGGYRNDNGTSLRASDLAFKVFLISDTIAMVSSVVATFILINTGSLDYDIRLYSLNAAKKLIWVALAGMTLAFGTNVLVVVNYKWLAVLVCVISSSVFFAAFLVTQWPSFDFLKTFKRGRFNKRTLGDDLEFIQSLRQAHFPKFMTPNPTPNPTELCR